MKRLVCATSIGFVPLLLGLFAVPFACNASGPVAAPEAIIVENFFLRAMEALSATRGTWETDVLDPMGIAVGSEVDDELRVLVHEASLVCSKHFRVEYDRRQNIERYDREQHEFLTSKYRQLGKIYRDLRRLARDNDWTPALDRYLDENVRAKSQLLVLSGDSESSRTGALRMLQEYQAAFDSGETAQGGGV